MSTAAHRATIDNARARLEQLARTTAPVDDADARALAAVRNAAQALRAALQLIDQQTGRGPIVKATAPECPQCGKPVYRTHTCTARAGHRPPAPKPSDFAAQVARARAANRNQQTSLPIDGADQ